MTFTPLQRKRAHAKLLEWYHAHHRDVPWRSSKGQKPDPYAVWLSEIMCQQTTVPAVKPYFQKFLAVWPTVQSLARAPEEDVMEAWAGLGYYARARNLHKAAKIISKDYNGHFPRSESELIQLPGIGLYTAAAISAFAFGQPAVIVDGNIERIMARLYEIQTPFPQAKSQVVGAAQDFYTGLANTADVAQALMDLGSALCIPKTPRCGECPISRYCSALKSGNASQLPIKSTKHKRAIKYGYVYWITNTKGEVLACRRPRSGLLGGMLALPSNDWVNHKKDLVNPASIIKGTKIGSISHSFSHFDLELTLAYAKLKEGHFDEFYFWSPPDSLAGKMPSVFQKAYSAFIAKTL